MMGHRDKLKAGGDEFDLVGRWRRLSSYLRRPRICRAVKRRINRRARRAVKLALREQTVGK